MQPEHLQQLQHLDEQLDGLEGRFSHHLEMYANNNKELERLGNLIDKHIENQTELMKSLSPIVNFYRTFEATSRFTKITFRGAMKIAGVFMALGGLYLMFRQIFHK